MTPRAAALLALLLIIILAACQAATPPSEVPPSATPEPTPVTSWTTFTSERFAYTIDYPADWRAVEGAGTANVSELRPFTGGSDMIASEEAYRFKHRQGLQVASVELEPGQTLEEFTQSVHMPCGGSHAHEETALDGEPAVHRRFRCDGNHPVYLQVTALHEGRGYVLWFMTIEPPLAFERPEYASMLESFAWTEGATASEDGS